MIRILAMIGTVLALNACAHLEGGPAELGPVEGTVKAFNGGESLPDVLVEVVKTDRSGDKSAPMCKVVSNELGKFRCEELTDPRNWKTLAFKRGTTYEIRASMSGYHGFRKEFKYTASLEPFNVRLRLMLGPDDIRVPGVDEDQGGQSDSGTTPN